MVFFRWEKERRRKVGGVARKRTELDGKMRGEENGDVYSWSWIVEAKKRCKGVRKMGWVVAAGGGGPIA